MSVEPLPPHLGGHENVTHVDEGSLAFLRNGLRSHSMLDVGCGPGGQVLAARRQGMEAAGIDGDWRLCAQLPDLIVHDYAAGPYAPQRKWNVAWCVEMLEHLDERFLGNVFRTFRRCGLVVMTHALPGTEDSHHHVNCRTPGYWRWQFETRGFEYHEALTERVRANSTMGREFIRNTGMVFVNRAWK